MNTILETARKFMSLGVAVIPVMYREKKPSIPWSCYRGGIPGSKLPTESEVKQWFPALQILASALAGTVYT